MAMAEEPYFMKNKEWYKFDKEQFKYVLTSKAPKEAIESYKLYYGALEPDENGMIKFL